MFTVYGTPVPQGSSRAFIPKGWERPVITAANSKTKPWRNEIANVLLGEMEKANFSRIEGPVHVSADFYFDKPKSAKKQSHKTTKPDLDKLLRALLDAMTGIAFKDDAQVIHCVAGKWYGSPARVEVIVSEAMPF